VLSYTKVALMVARRRTEPRQVAEAVAAVDSHPQEAAVGVVDIRPVCLSSIPRFHMRPARLSTPAGTPTSRSAAALIPLRFAHEAATFTNASSNWRSRWAWSI
jgi:hypothetical protein